MIHTRCRSSAADNASTDPADRATASILRLLGQERVVREGTAQGTDDELLGQPVDLGDDVVLGLVDDPLEPLVALHLQPAGAPGSLDRDRQLMVMARR